MSKHWLTQGLRTIITTKAGVPQFIAVRGLRLPFDTLGFLMNGRGPDGAVFILIAPNINTLRPEGISRLVALAMIDSKMTLFQCTLMPARPAYVFVKTNGEVWHQVIRSLPEWSLNECERLSQLLVNEHGSFLRDFVRGVLDESFSAFQPLSSDFLLGGVPGKLFSFDPPHVDVDTSGFQQHYSGLERHKIIRLDYERDRYMQHLSLDRLMQRANDIMRNIHQIDENGRITIDNKDPRSYYWKDRFTEILQEAQLRQIPYEDFGRAATKEYPFPKDRNRPRNIASLVETTNLPKEPYLVRYGHYDHIVEAYRHGRVRLAPATSYADPSLNPAMRDDELTAGVDLDTRVFRVDVPEGLNIGDRFPIKATFNTNFYIFCTSSCLRTRLFLDFADSNACLIITDPDAFKERLFRVLSHTLPDFHLQAERVKYYDPLCVALTEIRPIFWKHFRYSYQEEVRFAAIPSVSTGDLDPVFVSIGSLEDIAILIDARGQRNCASP